jgi:hypothetical protein
VLAFGVARLGAVFAAMFAMRDDERGGEGGRPVEGATCDVSGSARFSRGFLNIGMCLEQGCVSCRHGYAVVVTRATRRTGS